MLEAESAKLREEAKLSESCLVVLEYAGRCHEAALKRESARCVGVEKESAGHLATIAAFEEPIEARRARIGQLTTSVE